MSVWHINLWHINYERVYAQIQVNASLNRLEWKPNELKDNIFELIAIVTEQRDLRIKGKPYPINKIGEPLIYAWDFDYNGNPSRRVVKE